MIYLGLAPSERARVIDEYRREHAIRKVFVLSPSRFRLPGWSERVTTPAPAPNGQPGTFIDWPDIVEYRFFYHMMAEIVDDTLLVINEGLRTQKRHDLAYNCVRNYARKTRHVLVFNALPIIENADDFMILIDWCTRSKWAGESFSPSMLSDVRVHGTSLMPVLDRIDVAAGSVVHARYAAERERLLAEIRADIDKDPHILPRALHLVSGQAKAQHASGPCLGRNQRLRLPGLETFRGVATPGERMIVEFPHNFIDYADALAVTRAPRARVLVADTKADGWYFDRYAAWAGRVRDAASIIHG